MKKQHDKGINKMKEQYDKVIEENNKLNTKIEEQSDFIKSLKEELGAEDAGTVVQEGSEETLFAKPKNKNPSNNLCLTCEQRFKSNNYLEQHIQDVHTKLLCIFCDQICRSTKELDNHSNECIDIGHIGSRIHLVLDGRLNQC